MLNEKLEKRSKIGSPKCINFVASWLSKNTTNIETIKQMASATSGINPSEVEPILLLFESMGLVKIAGEYVECPNDLKQKYAQGEQIFTSWFVERFVEFALDSGIINIDTITYSIEYDAFIMSSNTIKSRHACYRNVLTDYQVITLMADARYLVNELLDNAIKKPTRHHAISEKQLLHNLQLKREQGERGELFVMEYERMRLTNESLRERIKRISIIDVASGFDIISFNSNESTQLDRFIEVKTYKGSEHFHWSQNEIEKAGLMGDSYFLYLVDDDCIDKEDYEPTVIQNPVKNVLQSDDWLKNPDSLLIERVQNDGYHSTTIISDLHESEKRELRETILRKDGEINKMKQELENAAPPQNTYHLAPNMKGHMAKLIASMYDNGMFLKEDNTPASNVEDVARSLGIAFGEDFRNWRQTLGAAIDQQNCLDIFDDLQQKIRERKQKKQ